MKKNIAILHSGNLKDISQGGISEYVAQFIENAENRIILFGTEHKSEQIRLFKQYKRLINGKEYIFIPINYSDKKPLSVFFFLNFIIFLIFNPKLRSEIKTFYAQRMEFVLPFYLFWGQNVSFAIHGSGKYATLFWGKKVAYFYNLLEKLSVLRAKQVFVLNNNKDFGLPYYKEKYAKYKKKIFYTPVPVKQSFFVPMNKESVRKKHGFAKNEKIILFFGRIENNPKRVFLLPKILKEVKKKHYDTKMIIIGSGNDRNKLIEQFRLMDLEESVKFYDHLNHDIRLVELINCADISVVCSTFEGICMSAIESLSCSIPVIATNVGSIKDYLKDGYNGFLVNKDEDMDIISEFSNKISKFFIEGLTFDNKNITCYDSKEVIKSLEVQMDRLGE